MANRSEFQHRMNRGVMRDVRRAKRQEAEERNSRTAPDHRRAFWKERGFSRKSQAASLVSETVADCNQRAVANKQRSADWPLLPDVITEAFNA